MGVLECIQWRGDLNFAPQTKVIFSFFYAKMAAGRGIFCHGSSIFRWSNILVKLTGCLFRPFLPTEINQDKGVGK